MTTGELDRFATWIEELIRRRGFDIDSPRGGGKSRLADEAGVHRAAITRLLQRQSMPDLETTRRLAQVLQVPVRDMLIQSGRLTEDDLPLPSVGQAPRVGGASRWRRLRTVSGSRRTSGRCSSGSPASSCPRKRSGPPGGGHRSPPTDCRSHSPGGRRRPAQDPFRRVPPVDHEVSP